jgi:hypothetical protein
MSKKSDLTIDALQYFVDEGIPDRSVANQVNMLLITGASLVQHLESNRLESHLAVASLLRRWKELANSVNDDEREEVSGE